MEGLAFGLTAGITIGVLVGIAIATAYFMCRDDRLDGEGWDE